MDFPYPADLFPGKQPLHPVGTKSPMMELMAERNVNPPEGILMVYAAGFDGVDFFRQCRGQPLVRI